MNLTPSRPHFNGTRLTAIACVLAGFGAGAFAQTPAGGNSNLRNTLPQPPRAPAPQVNTQVQRPAPGSQVFEQTPVRLDEVKIAGVKSLPFAQVSAVFKPLLHTTTTVGDIVKAAQAITKMYADAGYAISYAYVPAQDVTTGTIQVVVVEGYVSRVAIEGSTSQMEPAIRRIASNLLEEKPLTRASFERYVSLVGRLPGVGVDANVPVPDTIDGSTELQLRVRVKHYAATYAIDFNHPGIEGVLTGTVNGLTSLGDQLSASVMAPRGRLDRNFESIAYALPLGDEGLTTRLDAYRYRARPRDFFFNGTALAQNYTENRFGVMFSYPLLLDAQRSVVIEGGGYASRSGDELFDPSVPETLDTRARVRALQASIAGTWQRKTWSSEASLNIAHGIDGNGARQAVPLVDLDFNRVRASGRRNDEWFNGAVTTFVTGVVQQTPDRLPATEKISFGGSYFGAAYPTGDVSGDAGIAFAAEVGKPFNIDSSFVERIEPFIGADYARVRINAIAFKPEAIGSAIVGVRVSKSKLYSVALAAAKPTGARPNGETGRPVRWNVQAAVTF